MTANITYVSTLTSHIFRCDAVSVVFLLAVHALIMISCSFFELVRVYDYNVTGYKLSINWLVYWSVQSSGDFICRYQATLVVYAHAKSHTAFTEAFVRG